MEIGLEQGEASASSLPLAEATIQARKHNADDVNLRGLTFFIGQNVGSKHRLRCIERQSVRRRDKVIQFLPMRQCNQCSAAFFPNYTVIKERRRA